MAQSKGKAKLPATLPLGAVSTPTSPSCSKHGEMTCPGLAAPSSSPLTPTHRKTLEPRCDFRHATHFRQIVLRWLAQANSPPFSITLHCGVIKRKSPRGTPPGRFRIQKAALKVGLSSHAWRGLRSDRCRRRFNAPAASRLRNSGSCNRFHSPRRYCQVLSLADEAQSFTILAPIDAHQVAQVHLLGSQQIRQRVNHVPLDGSLEVSRSIALVGSFLQEELSSSRRNPEEELALRRLQNSLLYLPELDLQHFLELFPAQGMEDHHFVQPVHEFRRKFPARRFHCRPLDLLVKSCGWFVLWLHKAHAALHKFGDLSAAQVRRQENHRLRQIHSAVVSQG